METIIMTCNGCGIKNRVPKDRLKENPVCGKCGRKLDGEILIGSPLNITDQSFSTEVVSHDGLVMVDCWAPWCAPCRTIGPILESLAEKYAGRIKITKLNVDENPVTASRYGIKSIPTLLFFQNGNVVDSVVGALSKHEIEKHIQGII